MRSSKVTSKGQITIPKSVRRQLGIRSGSEVAFAVRNGRAEMRVVHRAPETLISGFGMLKAQRRHLPAGFDAASVIAPRRRASR